ERIWEVLLAKCDELGGVQWAWQAADGCLGKARFGGEKGGQKPHRSSEKRHQEVRPGRRRRRAAGGGDRGGERPRLQVAAGDDRGNRGRAARADDGATTTPLP